MSLSLQLPEVRKIKQDLVGEFKAAHLPVIGEGGIGLKDENGRHHINMWMGRDLTAEEQAKVPTSRGGYEITYTVLPEQKIPDLGIYDAARAMQTSERFGLAVRDADAAKIKEDAAKAKTTGVAAGTAAPAVVAERPAL